MKLDFPWQADRKRQYCVEADCHAEAVERTCEDGRELFHCRACDRRNERRIVVDPAQNWWIADDGEYWHESAGVFVRDQAGRFLFFDRRVFPVSALTVPAGHVDAGESPERAARRELHEETGWNAPRIEHVASADIVGDSCRRGADAHRWHAYLAVFDSPNGVRLSGEGENEQWLTLAEALAKALTRPVRYIVERYADALEQAK